jgi:CheY-like chemotaxis protein
MTRQGQTILVADDEWEVRELVRTILEWEDYAVVEAKDGEDALAQARAIQPDLILLDVRMPKMNGLDVLESLQADPTLASIPVVMLSVLTNYPQVGAALRNGAIAYLPKPFEIPDLARMVKRVLTGNAARREVIRQHAVKSLIESW